MLICISEQTPARKAVAVALAAFAVLAVLLCLAMPQQAHAVSNAKVKSVLGKKLASIEKNAPEGAFYFSGVHHKHFDVDGDGKVELLVHYGTGGYGQAINLVYKYKAGKAKKVLEEEGRGLEFAKSYPKTKTIVLKMGYKDMVYTYWLQYSGGKFKQKCAKLDARNYTGSLSYMSTKNKTASKATYNRIVKKLKKGSAKTLNPWMW